MSTPFYRRKLLWIIAALVAIISFIVVRTREVPVDFSADVKPILNKKCITCHGGVKAKGGFSLLFRDQALAKTESGRPAIIPGDPGNSDMIRRLKLKDPEERMPYKHEPLTDEEIDVLTRWVKQGAKWGDHWAYVPLKPVAVPGIKDPWIRNDVDRFVLRRLQEEKLTPSQQADKATLLRRVSLDLIGMPAPAALADKFLKSNDTGAYSWLVDSLLASPHYGERWAAMWMDLARYADTKGYERDDSRSVWAYRDWLIRAFDEDKPYDRFLLEQIAGDLLPNPTDAQYIATAFHRNTMTNDEGGTDNEEFRTAAVMDRVNTTWEALMGTTFACVQCHSHPYDPFKHEEYYKFLAYFNDSRDEDTFEDYPLLRRFPDSAALVLNGLTTWVERQSDPAKAQSVNRFIRTWEPSIHSLTADKFVNSELNDTKWLTFRNHGSARLKHVDLRNADQLVYRSRTMTESGAWSMHLDSVKGPLLARVLLQPKDKGWEVRSVDIARQEGFHDIYFTYDGPGDLLPDRNAMQFDWLHFDQRLPGEKDPEYTKYRDQFWKLLTAHTPVIPVMMDNPGGMHRASNVFVRGNWMVKGEAVEPGVPASLSAAMPANAPKNRMGLAEWLTSKKNPLVARTMVNRLWEQLFGTGIAETLEDMGTQGAPPTHRELLDMLAYRFMNDYGWSVKRLLKEMVMSAAYRQDSKVTEELRQTDLFNRLYARGPRVRLSAEQVRDQALCWAGSVNEKMYGPSVFPFQPKGIWLSPWNGAEWKMSDSGQQYRRALYTYWKRTAPYPAMITFDGASREVCTARRIRTNTPLQALVTLNDSSYIDLARLFARRMQKEGGSDPRRQISKGFELMLYHPAAAAKVDVLMGLYRDALKRYHNGGGAAGEMNGGSGTAETAAMTVVANAMLNLDDVITKS